MTTSRTIEPLETRIAPAAVFVTYSDLDGDLVKITAGKPGAIAPPLDAADLAFVGGGASGQLATLDLTDAAFSGTSITFTVTRKPSGDGLAHVGFINAANVDLDRVVVKGDLARIAAGDTTTSGDPGLNSLTARSMGTLGLETQGGMGNLSSFIRGTLGALRVTGDFTDAFLQTLNATDGRIGSIFIGGSLVGGDGAISGRILSAAGMGDVRIAGDVVGGAGGDSGSVFSNGSLGRVLIGGDVIGGAGVESGRVFASNGVAGVSIGGDVIGGAGMDSGEIASAGAMGNVQIRGSLIGGGGETSGYVNSGGALGNVRIGGDLTGGAGIRSGRVESFATMGNVQIGGDIIGGAGGGSGHLESVIAMGNVQIGGSINGGAGSDSGRIYSDGTLGGVRIRGDIIGGAGNGSGSVSSNDPMGHVRIGGDLVGGSVAGADSLSNSGQIFSSSRIASVTIGGSLIAGSDASTGSLTRCGAIVTGDDLGPLKIAGSILGSADSPALIIARGQDVKPAAGFDTAIASLTVGGDVRFARILAGFNILQMPANADAAIGAVSVGRDWAASSLVAGAEDTGADGFGVNDSLQTAGNTGLIARIASITIKGDATGSLAAGDHLGFVAQQIDKLKIGARTFTLVPGPSSPADNFLLPFTGDVHLLEV